VPTLLARAHAMYERARALGGNPPPIGSTPLTTEDRCARHGTGHQALRMVKEDYDPAHILTPDAGTS
jgi:hypothetical protein